MNRRQHTIPALSLSYAEAARMLRIDRSTTLVRLVKAGLVRSVPWGKGWRIPREDVERLARDGWTEEQIALRRRRPVPRRTSAPVAGVEARIRAIKVEP